MNTLNIRALSEAELDQVAGGPDIDTVAEFAHFRSPPNWGSRIISGVLAFAGYVVKPCNLFNC